MSAKSDLISSDDSDCPIKETSSKTLNRQLKKSSVLQKEMLTSDSEDEVKEKKKKKTKKRKEIMLGEISLLTSDEETESPPKKAKPKATCDKINTIELVTSDEETPIQSASTSRKRKLSAKEKNAESPTKKTKGTTLKKNIPRAKKTVAKRNISTEVTDDSLNMSLEDVNPTWKDHELLAERTQIDEDIAKNLIKLWEEGNTIPFIARYRKNIVRNMTPEELRTSKECYDAICNLKRKMCTVVKVVKQQGKLDNRLQQNISAARTIEELNYIYAPYKSDGKRTLADRARKCGLEEPAFHLLNNTSMVSPIDYVDPEIKDIKTAEDVEKGIMHIMAHEIATNPELLLFLRDLRAKTRFILITKRVGQNKVKEKSGNNSAKNANNNNKGHPKKDPIKEEAKFEIYFDFSQPVTNLKPHQVLAINRGEAQKILSVKIEIPYSFESKFRAFCDQKWISMTMYDDRRKKALQMAIDDAYQRLIVPLITREIRADLKQMAEKESCRVFSDNLKHLLIIPPIKGKPILGIDPGYSNGCKLALISPTGSLLAHNVIYPHKNKENRGEIVIKNMLLQHRCELIAIGNGTACRQTEEWISELIKRKFFDHLDVKYTIVSEDGASIYSCSPEAAKEFHGLDPNIISAVSLARRVQDPMAELVKVEPCHLGVGMYQLDIKKKHLEEALNEVVSECVSFVGVDLNTASQCLLRRVAGLSDKRATQIIDHRERDGPFTHRRQLLEVFGIGERIFEQCAGFLRVGPTSSDDADFYEKKLTTPLDSTIIHPESYPIVRSLLGIMDLKEKDIGSDAFIRNFKQRSLRDNKETLAKRFNTNKETIQLIFDALSKTLNHDLRTEVSETPLFKKGIISMEALAVGTNLTGRVKNVVSFGAFVDIGVESDGLVHVTHMKGVVLHLGDFIEVKVLSVDRAKGHIGLETVRKL